MYAARLKSIQKKNTKVAGWTRPVMAQPSFWYTVGMNRKRAKSLVKKLKANRSALSLERQKFRLKDSLAKTHLSRIRCSFFYLLKASLKVSRFTIIAYVWSPDFGSYYATHNPRSVSYEASCFSALEQEEYSDTTTHPPVFNRHLYTRDSWLTRTMIYLHFVQEYWIYLTNLTFVNIALS
jgi:hypothetical protein